MNKEEFVTMVKEELTYKLEDRYPGISVTVQETGGPGKAPYLGATIHYGEGNVFPVLNLDAIYEECGNWPEYEIMQELIEKSANGIENSPGNFDTESMLDYKNVRDHLKLCINPVNNEANLDRLPHVMEGPYPLIVKYKIPNMVDSDAVASITVTNEILEKWDKSIEEVVRDAKVHMFHHNPASVMSMSEMLSGMGMPVPEDNNQTMYIVTTTDRTNGAGVIFSKGTLDFVAERMNTEGYYILPSSVHEILCLRDSAASEDLYKNVEDLTGLVNEVNETQVQPGEQIVAVVTHYDAKAKIFETAVEYAERKSMEEKMGQEKNETMEKNEEQEMKDMTPAMALK